MSRSSPTITPGEPEIDGAEEPLRAAMLHERVGEYHFDDDPAALRSYRTALDLLPGDAQAQRAHILTAEGRVLLRMRCHGDARLRCVEALAIAEAVGSDRVTTAALVTLGMTLTLLGDPAAGAERISEALRMARALGAVEDVGHALIHLAETYRLQGRHEQALALMIEGEAEARRWGVQGSFGAFMQVNAIDDLIRLGRWDEAEQRLADGADADLGSTAKLLRHALRGQLHVLKGRYVQGRQSLQAASELLAQMPSCVDFIPAVQGGWAMLALGEHRPGDAREHAAAGLAEIAEADASESFYTPNLYVLALRAEAELAETARAGRSSAELCAVQDEARATWARLVDLLVAGTDRTSSPESCAFRALARAELTRVIGPSDADAWATAAALWEELDEPYPAAYARFHQADAVLRAGGGPSVDVLLRDAHAAATALGARPLVADIENLARRARIELAAEAVEPAPSTALSAVQQLGLTSREVDVLALLAEGLTNRQIAERLFISQKTAGTHVAHIFDKLDVHNRVEASGVAHRIGIVDLTHETG